MLSDQIKCLRTAQRLSQVELANKLCVSKQTVSNWENNNIQPSIDMLVRLSDVFGVSTDYLLDRDPIPRLSVEGLTIEEIQHLRLLVDDLHGKTTTPGCV